MYRIITDTSANLPWPYIQAHNIPIVPFSYYIEDVEHNETPGSFDGAAYYQAIREGAKASTSQIPPQRFVDTFEPVLKAGEDVLFLSMSSGISGSCASAGIAAEELSAAYPERQIRVVDTLGASLGEGLQVMEALSLQEAGQPLEAVAETIEARRKNICQLLLVDDLLYLRRTGRVSGVTAVVGSMLGIKPILKGNEEGLLVVSAKVRGRRQAIAAMAERYAELARDPQRQRVGIAHADCPADAALLAQLIEATAVPAELVSVCYEPVTGAHTGPDALALFFYGDDDVRSKY